MKKLVLLPVLLLSIATAQAQDTTYDWVSADGVTDISGTITLDAPSSPVGGGGYGDIVSFSVTDPNGTYYWSPANNAFLVSGYSAGSPFTWNPSQITSMDVSGEKGFLVGSYAALTNNGISQGEFSFLVGDYNIYSDSDGSWDVSVPDAGNTALLLGVAIACLASLSVLRRSTPLSRQTRSALASIFTPRPAFAPSLKAPPPN